MRVTVLCDNHAGRGTIGEHGLSLLVEGDRNVLFDVGPGLTACRNARLLDIELYGVDYIVLSHGHSDHCGGLCRTVRDAMNSRIILHRETAWPRFSYSTGTPLYIGLPISAKKTLQAFEQEDRLIYADKPLRIASSFMVFPVGGRSEVPDEHDFTRKTPSGEQETDMFKDELAMLFEGTNEAVLFTGCAHSGLIKTYEAATALTDKPVKYLFGGSHLAKADDEVIRNVADFFKNCGTKLFLGHCTGVGGFARLARHLDDDQLHSFNAGAEIDLRL